MRKKTTSQSALFQIRLAAALFLLSVAVSFAVASLAGAPSQAATRAAGATLANHVDVPKHSSNSGSPGAAQASAPGSTCQNLANPLATTCETWLARYAAQGSSDDNPAAL